MREEADARGADLLVIDTGDRVEGNGLYDSSEPKGIYLSEILREQHLDLLSAGNHELYKQDTSEAEFLTTVPNFRGHYLASNLDIVHPDTKEVVPLARRFRKFTTPNQGIRIAAFGFIFDFTGNANNTIIQPVEKAVKNDWFQEVIRDVEVDLFLVIGHVPLRSKEYKAVLKEIRAVRGDIPIQFFGGHLHVRDYTRYDASAHGLASGRFLETIGFMSIDGLSTGQHSASSTLSFFRRYIDNNLFSFHHHTNLDEDSFPTRHGREVSRLIEHSRSDLGLDVVHGCAPRDLWMSRVKYPSKDSIYTWLEQDVLHSLRDKSRDGHPALAVVNTGAIRFDIFEGPFTQDTTFIISPFTSGFRYVKDVPYDKAELVVEILNKQPQILDDSLSSSMVPPQQHAYPEDLVDLPSEMQLDQAPMSDTSARMIPGYKTIDDNGTDGDDTVHSRVPFYRVPNCIHALISNSTWPETVDLVYIDFIEPRVVQAAKVAGLDVNFSKESDTYMPSMTLTNLILQWVKENWECE